MSLIGAWVFVDVVETASFKDPQQAGFFMAVDPYSPKCYNTHKKEEKQQILQRPLSTAGLLQNRLTSIS
jgi:hypothetical protein